MSRAKILSLAWFTLAGLAIGSSWGGPVRTWQASSQSEFAAGTLEGTAIEEEGRIRLALSQELLWGPEDGIVWDVEPGEDGSVFVALSSPPRVVRVSSGGPPVVWYEPSEETLVAAIVSDGRGGLYAGTSPQGVVWHLRGPGQMEVVAETGAKFVWDLARAKDGAIWIATGVPGALLRYETGEKLRNVFESGEDPVRCVRTLVDGRTVFGTGARGLVIRLAADSTPFVLHDAEETEIVAIEEGKDGSIYALAARAPRQVGSTLAAPGAVAGVQETVRVTASAPPAEDSTDDGDESERPTPARTSPQRFVTPPGGALYRILPDGATQRIWQENRDVPFGLTTAEEDQILVATGDRGRIYSLDPLGHVGLLLEIPSDQASAIARGPGGALIVGGTTDARLLRLGPGFETSGRYLTQAVDALSVADWGRLVWDAEVPRGAGLRVSVRGGNTGEPDGTWSEWISVEAGEGGGGPTRLPPTRWFQARVEMRPNAGGHSPRLRRIQLFYVPRNRPPMIQDVIVLPAGVVWVRSPVQSPRPTGPSVATGPVVEEVLQHMQPGSMVQPIRKFYEQGARTITWSATDPDGDALRFRLELRREGEPDWIPLASDIEDEFHGWDARGMADGAYRARLTVDDAQANPDGGEYVEERVGPVFEIDNTPPEIGEPDVRRRDGGWIVEFVARDAGGRVTAVEVAEGDGNWRPLAPIDRVADSREESYRVEVAAVPLEGNEAGNATLRIRASDAAGNLSGIALVLAPGR